MKKIIDGIIYDTEEDDLIDCRTLYDNEGWEIISSLYRTRSDQYYMHINPVRDSDIEEIEPLSEEEAFEWRFRDDLSGRKGLSKKKQ